MNLYLACMNQGSGKIRLVLSVCAVIVGQLGAAGTPRREPQLLATVPYAAADTTRLLSLWEVPLAADHDSTGMKTTLSGQVTGVHLPPNVAFVLVDGALNSPFSGNLVWALEATESMLPQDMTVVTGSIAWHSGQQRTYVVLSHSGGSWVRLGVYQTDLKPLGPYTPLSPPAASQGILGPNRSDAKPFATWESNNLSSHGLFEVNAVQTLVEPESLVIHLVDANTLKRINTVNPTHYQGELDLKLGLINGVWSNITRRTGPPLEPVTARGVLSRGQGKAGDLWTLTLDHPIYVRNPDAGESAAGVEVKLLRFVGGRKGPQDSHYAGKHVELSGTLVSPASPGVAGVKVQTITVLE